MKHGGKRNAISAKTSMFLQKPGAQDENKLSHRTLKANIKHENIKISSMTLFNIWRHTCIITDVLILIYLLAVNW